jgi:hypothetical protein
VCIGRAARPLPSQNEELSNWQGASNLGKEDLRHGVFQFCFFSYGTGD